MIHQISILWDPLLDACVAQTSGDFRGLRSSQGGQIDMVYDDFTLSRDDQPEAMGRMKTAAMAFGCKFSAYIQNEMYMVDGVSYEINVQNRRSDCRRLRAFLEEYIKSDLLNWWYSGRNSGLANREFMKATEALEHLAAEIIPTTCTRKLRWF